MSGMKLKLKGQDVVDSKVNVRSQQELQKEASSVQNQGVLKFNNYREEDKTSSTSEKASDDSGNVQLRFQNDEDYGPRVKPKKKKSNRYFYKVSNHHELFKIGRSFHTDYLAGVKSFAITSTGYQTSQQKTILGLASFFDHKEDVKIAIVSDNLNFGAFKDIVLISKNVTYNHFGSDRPLEIKSFYNHFEFINLNDLLKLSNDSELGEYDEVFDQIVDLYDIVFWDVPELHKIQMDSERYFPVIMKFESISIIVSQSLTKKSDVEDIKKFFLGYGINLKGLLLEEKTALDEEQAKKKNQGSETNRVSGNTPWWKKILGMK